MSVSSLILEQSVLPAYDLKNPLRIEKIGGGLINNTWKIQATEGEFILQRVNDSVFKNPRHIAHNISLISKYLEINYPNYFFVCPLTSIDGQEMIYLKEIGFFRLFPFVIGSQTKEVVTTPEQAYEAAKQFGRFTKMLRAFDTKNLKETIPHFHNLHLRYQQFITALKNGKKNRIGESKREIQFLLDHSNMVSDYNKIVAENEFKTRVTHHDTKISNILFDSNDKGLCVIDLDTVMPGYFISDVGDMMRTYLSPVSEEETDFLKIHVREVFYQAVVEGFYGEMENELTSKEKNCFFYAGKWMIYMQALRFLTDHLNDDKYYGAVYTGHNLTRARNQMILLQNLMEMEKTLTRYLTFV